MNRRRAIRIRALAVLGTVLLLAACTPFRGGPATPDPVAPATGEVPAAPTAEQIAAIPDAVPRVEPRSKYGNPESYEVFGQRYRVMESARGHIERGTASWYGPGFHAERTSSGEPYDMYAMTAAHKTLPIPSYVRVTHLGNGQSVVVRVNDRGPFVGDRIIDLSYTAAAKLDMIQSGTAPVEIRVLEPGEPSDTGLLTAANGTSAAEPNLRVWRANRIPSPQQVAARTTVSAAVTTTAATTAATSSASSVLAESVGTSLGAVTLNPRFLQTGAFATRVNAEAMVTQLTSAGIRNVQIREALVGERRLYRVHVGPIDGAIEADDMIERLRLAGVPDARAAHE